MSEDPSTRLVELSQAVATEFAATRSVLSFGEWFQLLCAAPKIHARNSAQYVRDALRHYGTREVRAPGGSVTRWCLFDRPFDGGPRLVAQEVAQNRFFEYLEGACRLGRVNSLVLLHGPNGSAKSTLLEILQRGLEAYSQTDEGALYRFSWVFQSKEPKGGGIGFGGADEQTGPGGWYMRHDADAIESRITDEVKDHPILLIPPQHRHALLTELLPDSGDFSVSQAILHGELSTRNRKIFDALLTGSKGDLAQVLEHVQVERFFLSRTYRLGLADVEPKQTVDARVFAVTGDRAFSHLPPAVGGQVLHGLQGDLVDANRGVVNFADLLKRPYEHYKYLLTATETGRIAVDQVVLGLDVVFTGSANDVNLLEFRSMRSAEYQSFRARLELIPVPYLLDYRVERKIYQEQVGDLLRGVRLAPNVPRILALWGVMSRLRRPDPQHYSDKITQVLRKLTPLEKADLYAYGRVPANGLGSDEARELLAAIPAMHAEKFPHAVVHSEGSDLLLGDYEGSFGASVRDLKGILLAVASESGARCVTVPKLFDELRQYLSDSANHRWMLLEPAGAGFQLLDGDERSITTLAFERWLELSDWEVREAMGLVAEDRYLELFRKYVIQVKYFLRRERIFDEVTGSLRDPDTKFMSELESAMDPKANDSFRPEILGRIGAWALSHPNEEPNYPVIFPDYFARLREDYYRQQKDLVRRAIQFMLELLRTEKPESEFDLSGVEQRNARHALEVLLGEHDEEGSNRERHTRESLKDTLVQLAKLRY